MLLNAYLLAKIGADTAENERNCAEILPHRSPRTRRRSSEARPPGRAGAPARSSRRPRGEEGVVAAWCPLFSFVFSTKCIKDPQKKKSISKHFCTLNNARTDSVKSDSAITRKIKNRHSRSLLSLWDTHNPVRYAWPDLFFFYERTSRILVLSCRFLCVKGPRTCKGILQLQRLDWKPWKTRGKTKNVDVPNQHVKYDIVRYVAFEISSHRRLYLVLLSLHRQRRWLGLSSPGLTYMESD